MGDGYTSCLHHISCGVQGASCDKSFQNQQKRTSKGSIKVTTVANHSFIKLGKSLKNVEAQLKQVKVPCH